MTVCVAWIRRIGGCEELVFASDSRLSGGRSLDFCPKILALSRSDCAIAFAGDTDFAYPLMLQLSMGIETYHRSKSRAMDIRELKTHALKVFNSFADAVHDYVESMDKPNVSFIFGGYSWIHRKFDLWTFSYNKKQKAFLSKPHSHWLTGFDPIAFGGDKAIDARNRLISLLRERHSLTHESCRIEHLDMEPLEVLRDMLRTSKSTDSIGGALQVVKVYQHMNARPIGVLWPDQHGSVHLHGRPLLGYESTDAWILDPDSFRTFNLNVGRGQIAAKEI